VTPGPQPPALHPPATGGSGHGRPTFTRRVRERVRASVRAGYGVDEPVMEDRLVVELSAPRSSVRAALQQLADEGFLARQRRRGTTVLRRGLKVRLRDVTSLSDDPPGSGADPDDVVDIVLTEQRTVPSTPLLRERLGVDDDVVRMHEDTFVVADQVIGVRTAYFPARSSTSSAVPAGPVDEGSAEVDGKRVGRIRTEVACSVADDRTCTLFGVPQGSMVLVREQTVLDVDGDPVQVVFDNYRADRVTFVDDAAPLGG
jgi:GntR family transcriptional regulator